MAGIFQGDIFIKTAIELGIDDMRKNPWLIEHMLEDLKTNSYVKDKYGEKQIDACKEWLANTQVDVYMRPRDDKDRLPCVTIEMGPSNEKQDMRHLADQSTDIVKLLPNKIGKPISYIVKPFVPSSYDVLTGEILTEEDVDFNGVSPGMILVNPENGLGYTIVGLSLNGVLIEAGLDISASQLGIVPQYPYYKARIEHSFFDETYIIGCHAHGDPQTVLWLWSIATYSLLRYRESLLEANGFAESHIGSGGPDLNYDFSTNGGEKAYTRSITLHGQVRNTWIKSPQRIIESVVLKKKVSNGFTGGITIISNKNTPDYVDQTQEAWTTVEDDSEDE